MVRHVLFVLCLIIFQLSKAALSSEQAVNIVYNQGIAPIKFTNHRGEPSGIINDYWKFLADYGNLDISFTEVPTFSDSLEKVKKGDADLHAGLFFTQQRDEFLEYTDPILSLSYYLYSTEDLAPLTSLTKAGGLLVGIVQGGYTENYVKKEVPQERIIKYTDFDSMFGAVVRGELKAFVSSDIHLNYFLSVNNLTSSYHHAQSPLFTQTYYGAASENNSQLADKIKKIQATLLPAQQEELMEKWFTFKPRPSKNPLLDSLTAKERKWLLDHPVLKVSNEMDWPPFDFNQNDTPMGLSIDLLTLIAKRLNIELKYTFNRSWDELQELIKAKEIDVIHSLNRSMHRDQFILFTQPYISNQTVIVTSDDDNSISDADDLQGKTLAVIKGYNQHQILKDRFCDISFIEVDSPLTALKVVASGRADATIRFNSVAAYLIRHHMLTNLKFVNEFVIQESNLHDLFLGVRKDWPILQTILQKGLASVSHDEMKELKEKWFSLDLNSVEQQISFSPDEKNWLASHKEIVLGADFNWPPFDFSDEAGNHTGIAAEYAKIIEKQTGLKVQIRSGVWSDVLSWMKGKELDGLICAVETEPRKKYLSFTEPYLQVPTAIVTRKEISSILSPADLDGKTVSVNKGSYLHDWMKTRFPKVKLHLSSSNEASIEAVSYGEVDAYIGNLVVANYIIKKKLLTNLKIVGKLNEMVTKTAVAIDKEQPMLFSIINKVTNSVSPIKKREINEKWYLATTEKKVQLSPAERRFVKNNPVLRISGDPAWAPISFINAQGEYTGIIPDFLKLLESRSGLKFDIQKTEAWSEVLSLFKDGKLDLVDGITRSEERARLMDFTDVFISADIAFITRNDINFIKDVSQLDNYKVSTIKNYITETFFKRDFPDLELHLAENAKAGLKALSNGESDVFVIDIPAFEYYAREAGLSNLKISGLTPYSFDLSIGVQKKQPELLSILNKAISLVDGKEKAALYTSWVSLSSPLIDYTFLARVIIATLLMMALFFYWNRRLAKEVKLRKIAESKALQASRAKSQFLANMSHEIRTPMNSVLGFAELLDNMISDSEQKSYLKSIRSGGKSLLNIINDILDLSKIEAGKISLNPEPVSLANLFQDMENFFKARFAQKGLELHVSLSDDVPQYIQIDGTRLRQVLVNLIENALKFTESGKVELLGKQLALNENERTTNLQLVVRDTGPGIPKRSQKIIFKSFEQPAGQDEAKYGGTGLGLSICKNLVNIMGGNISVNSQVGEGSSFIIDLKGILLMERPDNHQETVEYNPEGFQSGTVIVADDVPDNRSLLLGFFSGSKLGILEAENGQDVLDHVSKQSIDLIFLDLRMPELNGYETITALRQNKASEDIPVIAFTASVMGEDMEKISQYGFDGYLRKPVGLHETLQLSSNFLDYTPTTRIIDSPMENYASSSSDEKLKIFLEEAKEILLPTWTQVKDKGDFELIRKFALEVKERAKRHELDGYVRYADDLLSNIESFEILEVDVLMKQFPSLITTQDISRREAP